MLRMALFARRPVPGSVKTRLSPALPPDLSARLHRSMVRDAMEAMAATPSDERIVYWTGAEPGNRSPSLTDVPPGIIERAQSGKTLGERLARAFEELLSDPEDRAVILGADCPSLGPRVLREAGDALRRGPLVLGPARDGGYYLIGLARRAPSLFENISWGTSRVLAETLDRASRAGLVPHLLEPLEDLDTPADLVRWISATAISSDPQAPHLTTALREIRLLPPGGAR
jgi:rSAM/selenodomain-associated transferase 1